MQVRIIFHPFDDIQGNKDRIEGVCILATEAETAKWHYRNNSHVLTFTSSRKPRYVIEMLEEEGFDVDEFVEIAFRG